MPKIQETRKYPGKPTGDVYQAVLKAAPQSGLEVWKRRDIAWLVMVRCGTGSDAIDGNISVRPGAQVTVSLSSTSEEQAALSVRAERVFTEIGRILE